jgi:hypothetical protein
MAGHIMPYLRSDYTSWFLPGDRGGRPEEEGSSSASISRTSLFAAGWRVLWASSFDEVQESSDPLDGPILAPSQPSPFRESQVDPLYVLRIGPAVSDQPRRYFSAQRQHLFLPRLATAARPGFRGKCERVWDRRAISQDPAEPCGVVYCRGAESPSVAVPARESGALKAPRAYASVIGCVCSGRCQRWPMAPWSAIARAGRPSTAARATSGVIWLGLSSSEYSVWTCRVDERRAHGRSSASGRWLRRPPSVAALASVIPVWSW